MYALQHPGKMSAWCNRVCYKYDNQKNKSETQDYSLTSCEVIFGGFRGFGVTYSVYPEDKCT
jgi:hypothetical protein